MRKRLLRLFAVFILLLQFTACSGKTDEVLQTQEGVADAADGDLPSVKDVDSSDSSLEAQPQEDDSEEIIVGENIIPNGDFSADSTRWGLYRETGGSASYTMNGKLRIRISSPGRRVHSVQMYCDGFALYKGGEYEMSFDISSDVERNIEWRIQINGDDYHPYVDVEDLKIGPDMQHIVTEFIMENESDPAPRLCFNLGDAGQEQGLGRHEIVIDNVSLILKNADNVQKESVENQERDIVVNQIGYRPNEKKRAVFRDASKDTEFEVVNALNNKSVYSGKLVIGDSAGSSGDIVAYADLSEIKESGQYYIKAANSGESFVFEVGDDIYEKSFDDVCRMLYLQRCGMELTKEYAGDFAHKACHTEQATIYGSDELIDVSGGWHDAGDYGRYVSPAAKAVADMMLAYENNPDVFSDNSGIPESGNGIPDILDEVRYELEWMLKMQAKDGGVYHKVTGLNFDGVVMPEDCTEKLFILPESKTATGGFTAAMYMAERVYKDFEPEFSKKCHEAAKKALPYLEERLSERNYVNPSDVSTGEYADTTSIDEYLWALCEGYKTTGDETYASKIKSFDYSKIQENGLGWATVTEYAYYAYLTSSGIEDVPYDFMGEMKKYADELKEIASKESYGSSLDREYPWGSNMSICNNGIIMLMASELTGDKSYIETALYQRDYIFGVNTCSYCFVTGMGTLSPVSVHHRPSQYLNKTMPGMLVGGPNSNLEDPYAKAVLADMSNAHRYVDNAQSYSCNEITIYWNSPLIYLMAALTK